jgi:hypothetical protein
MTHFQQQMRDKSDEAQAQETVASDEQDVKGNAGRVPESRLNRQHGQTTWLSMPKSPPTIPRPQRKESSPDKPLPSLPVATVRPRSPIVRRSLIDASEKPLRKSLSPSPGVKANEEWPAILPSRPTSPNAPQVFTEKTSGHVIGMSKEQLQDSLVKEQGKQAAKATKGNFVKAKDFDPVYGDSTSLGARLGGTQAPNTEPVKEKEQATEDRQMFTDANIQNMPAIIASVEKISYCQQHRPDRQPHQTKTSKMRARLSAGSNYLPEKERKSLDQDSTCPSSSLAHDHPKTKPRAIPPRLSIPGPVRSHSRPRREVSTQRCPYGQGRRVPM